MILIDEIAELPHGCKVVSVAPLGTSLWVQTVRIQTRLSDGTIKAFFKKVSDILRRTWQNLRFYSRTGSVG